MAEIALDVTELLTLVCCGAVALVLWARLRARPWIRCGAKLLASSTFVALAVHRGAGNHLYGQVLLAALALSWVGDLLLIYTTTRPFLLGLASFLLAHLFFAGAFAIREFHGLVWLCALGLLCLPVWGIGRWILPHVADKMKAAVLGYFGAITLMMASAFCVSWVQWDFIYAIGAVLFCASDVAVARQRFVCTSLWNPAMGLPLYYAAQLLFAYTGGG